jgi:hypothetical protein
MHVCCFVISFLLCFKQPLCSSMNRESIWCSQWLRNSIAWPYVAPRVFIAYFPKKNISLRQIILKILRVWEKVSHISSNWCLFESYLSWNLIGRNHVEEGRRKDWRILTGRRTRRGVTWPARPVPCITSASGRVKMDFDWRIDQTWIGVRSRWVDVFGHC